MPRALNASGRPQLCAKARHQTSMLPPSLNPMLAEYASVPVGKGTTSAAIAVIN
jgi:hypothetical protein